ncbi:VOC family protein [Novosphingobium piscinae]|uniref:VOC family protein n=1 Tax=Novosphingobium piscinae TaxID=1507448 RepID=A0A7X1FZI3_9SPHN|nr:VOC family protein [Novosphingobium piscinae]MBC2669874.1 VOC family protein [Novosphingobium piscinae]
MASDPLDNGFAEAVAIVADVDASTARLCAATGFARRGPGGAVPAGALALLGLDEGTGGREVLLGHPDSARGAIRLIQLDGPTAPRLRDGAQAWDSGGIFDINLRALPSIEALHARFAAQGFLARAPITDWDFGPLAVREVVEDDADGLAIALMERVRPPLAGYEGLRGPASWVFNSTQVVADFDLARRFYTKTLGWQVVQETEGMAAQPGGRNCMGLPLGLAADLPMRIGIYHPAGRMEGSVEIIAFGCPTLDFADRAPPLRGWAALRFPVRDLAAVLRRLDGQRVIGPVAFDCAPHGRVQAAAVVTPWGARLEFLQAG